MCLKNDILNKHLCINNFNLNNARGKSAYLRVQKQVDQINHQIANRFIYERVGKDRQNALIVR